MNSRSFTGHTTPRSGDASAGRPAAAALSTDLACSSASSGSRAATAASYFHEWASAELGERGQARLLLARHEGEALAAALDLRLGGRVAHVYAASASGGRHLKPNDLLQWEAIRRAQAAGCGTYDLWGIPDEVGRAAEAGRDPEGGSADALWGVYQFKRGFGGQVVRHASAFDWIYSPGRHWLWRTLQRERRRLRARAWPRWWAS